MIVAKNFTWNEKKRVKGFISGDLVAKSGLAKPQSSSNVPALQKGATKIPIRFRYCLFQVKNLKRIKFKKFLYIITLKKQKILNHGLKAMTSDIALNADDFASLFRASLRITNSQGAASFWTFMANFSAELNKFSDRQTEAKLPSPIFRSALKKCSSIEKDSFGLISEAKYFYLNQSLNEG